MTGSDQATSDEELAGRYFDETTAIELRADGMPSEGVDHLRQRYIRDAPASPVAMRHIRRHFGVGEES